MPCPYTLGMTVIWWFGLILLSLPVTAQAQLGCPVVDAVTFPIDRNTWALTQDFGARSVRHEGRYHAGEDWALPDGSALGQPVRAMASGQVTYAFGTGWGRDGGVVILAHTLPGDSVIYSVYGHLAPPPGGALPTGGACVEAGDVVGVISDSAPGPHLHFEVRTDGGRTPGAGYTAFPPTGLGYRDPSAFVTAWNARLSRGVAWVTTLRDARGPVADPLPLTDDSLLVLTDGAISRVLPDGRTFWRTTLDRPAVAVTALQGTSVLHYTDGFIQQVTPEGTLEASWQVPIAPLGAPFAFGSDLVFPVGGGLAALGNRRREVTRTTSGQPFFTSAHVGAEVIGLREPRGDLVTLRRTDFAVIDRATLRPNTSVTADPNGHLLAYTRSGLWRITVDGTWIAAPHSVPDAGDVGAVAPLPNGDVLLFDGTVLRRQPSEGDTTWAVDVPGVTGRAVIIPLDPATGRALLLSTGGTVATVDPFTGLCRWALPPAPDNAHLWAEVGADGQLRVAIGNTLAGFTDGGFSVGCPA
ncbi:MAG: M23 family metallopeptidase [Chloroflexota bacterium]